MAWSPPRKRASVEWRAERAVKDGLVELHPDDAGLPPGERRRYRPTREARTLLEDPFLDPFAAVNFWLLAKLRVIRLGGTDAELQERHAEAVQAIRAEVMSTVACPKCHAQIGERCLGRRGPAKPRTQLHQERHDAYHARPKPDGEDWE